MLDHDYMFVIYETAENEFKHINMKNLDEIKTLN
jgi:hypothetical protein